MNLEPTPQSSPMSPETKLIIGMTVRDWIAFWSALFVILGLIIGFCFWLHEMYLTQRAINDNFAKFSENTSLIIQKNAEDIKELEKATKSDADKIRERVSFLEFLTGVRTVPKKEAQP